MKKTKIFLIITLLLLSVNTVQAASGKVSISGPNKVEVGKSYTYSISFSASELSAYEFSVSSSDNSILAIQSKANFASDVAGSVTVTFKAMKSGEVKIVVKGEGASLQTFEPFPLVASFSVTSSTPSNNEAVDKPKPPTVDNTEASKNKPDKSPEQIEKEKNEAIEKERIEALEKKKKIPLINQIKIISKSDKYLDEIISTITTEESIFQYSYALPRKITEIELNIEELEGVEFIYEKNHKFTTDEKEKEIIIKAKNDEFEQEFKVIIVANLTEDIKVSVDEVEYIIYNDERMDKSLSTFGFNRVVSVDPAIDHYYSNDIANLQLLVNDAGEANWYILDNTFKPQRKVNLIKDLNSKLYFIAEADEEISNKTLYGLKYRDVQLPDILEYGGIDKSLSFDTTYKAWEFEDGQVFFGLNDNLEEGLFYISADEKIDYAVVAFDRQDVSIKYIAIGFGIAMLVIGATSLVVGSTLYYKKKRNFNIDM